MSLYNLEQELAKLCRKELSDLYKKQVVNIWGSTGRDIRDPDAPLGIYFYDESGVNSIAVKNDLIVERYSVLKELFMYKANCGEIYSDLQITVYPDGNSKYKYWFDEERLMKQEYERELSNAKDFPHAFSKYLVFYDLDSIKFRKNFKQIIVILEIKNGIPLIDVHFINGRNQVKSLFDVEVNTSPSYREAVEKIVTTAKGHLLKHYEATHTGIIKEMWKPWNKIVVSVPPSGYLNEYEDIHYYMDEVELEKDFFLEGY